MSAGECPPASRVSASEVSASEVSASEVSASEVSASEVSASHVSASHVSASQISPFDLLRAHADRAAEQPALMFETGVVRFDDLLDDVDRMMGLVCREGWTPGAVVGLAVADERLHLTAALALLSLGAPHVGLPGNETAESNRAVAARAGVSLLVAAGANGRIDGVRTVEVSHDAIRAAASGGALARRSPGDDAAIYVKTSGSTGVPKLFDVKFARIARVAGDCAADPAERRVMRTSSTEFDSSRLHRIYALLGGRGAVFAPKDLTRMGEVCGRFDVSQVHIGAYRLEWLFAAGRPLARFPASTGMTAGGSRVSGPLRTKVAEQLRAPLMVSYATSEVGRISTAMPDEHAAYPEGVGFPQGPATVEVVDDDGLPVAPGEIGAIRVKKPSSPMAYVGAEAHSPQFRDGWFYPNDRISQPEGGPLIYHGRADDVMMLSGMKVPGGAIEDTLLAHPDVREAVAFPMASRLHGEIPAAAVVLADGAGRDAARLLAYCRQAMGVRAPRRIVVLDEIPRTHTGKPKKRELAGL